jgi:hypothetical protein
LISASGHRLDIGERVGVELQRLPAAERAQARGADRVADVGEHDAVVAELAAAGARLPRARRRQQQRRQRRPREPAAAAAASSKNTASVSPDAMGENAAPRAARRRRSRCATPRRFRHCQLLERAGASGRCSATASISSAASSRKRRYSIFRRASCAAARRAATDGRTVNGARRSAQCAWAARRSRRPAASTTTAFGLVPDRVGRADDGGFGRRDARAAPARPRAAMFSPRLIVSALRSSECGKPSRRAGPSPVCSQPSRIVVGGRLGVVPVAGHDRPPGLAADRISPTSPSAASSARCGRAAARRRPGSSQARAAAPGSPAVNASGQAVAVDEADAEALPNAVRSASLTLSANRARRVGCARSGAGLLAQHRPHLRADEARHRRPCAAGCSQ